MKNKRKVSLLVAVSLLVFSVSLFAHHGNAGYVNKEVTVKGTVTQWLWTNPHTFLKFDVKDDKGNVVPWIGEWNAPSTLVNFGFNEIFKKPFDVALLCERIRTLVEEKRQNS